MENPPAPAPGGLPPLPTTPEARAAYIKAAQQQHDLAGLANLFKAELLASPVFAAAMAPYFAGGHAPFAGLYANAKAGAYLKGPLVVQETGERFVEVREAAAQHLWEIQQKKLFDLQCQWRAEQIALPGVRHCHEFRQWGTYIDHCPWLPPITADEVARYAAYLRSDAYTPDRNWAWQDYDAFRQTAEQGQPEDDEEHEEGTDDAQSAADHRAYRTLPAWYAYHDAATGAGGLLTLPDLRGEKEAYYITLTETDKQQQLAAQAAAGDVADSLPWHPLFSQHQNFAPYFQQFETPEELPRLLRWYEADRTDHQRRWGLLFEATTWIERALADQAAPWPIGAHPDWRVAVVQAGIRAWGHQLADALPEVWREQQQNQALGLPLTGPKQYGTRPPFEDVNWAEEDSYRPKFILRGRELAGESRDFNF